MATNYKQRGRIIDVVAAAAMVSGTPIIFGSNVGVPQNSGAIGVTVPVGVEGVYMLPLKTGGDAPVIGEPCHLNLATLNVSVGTDLAVVGDVNKFGYIAENGAADDDAVVAVKLTPGTGTVVTA